MSDEADRDGAVTVAYLHANDCTMSWHHSIIELLAHDMSNAGRVMRGGWIAMHSGTGGLVEARNTAVKTFLAEKNAEWLWWVDTDMGFEPDVIDRLLQAADPVGRPIVGGLCFMQKEEAPDGMGGYETRLAPTIYDWTKSGDQYGYAVRWQFPENTLVRCAGTGSACLLVHRSAFEAVERKNGPVWYDRVPNTTTGQLIGEDLSFCLRAGALNIPIYIHTGIEASHAKMSWLTSRQYRRQLQADAIQVQQQEAGEPTAVIVPVLGRPQNAAPFMASLKASTARAQAYAVIGQGDDYKASVDAWAALGAKIVVSQGSTFAEKVNSAYSLTSEPWILLVGDDVRFQPGWLERAQAKGADVVGTNDLSNPRVVAGEHTCHPLIRRSYVEEQGASWDGPGIVAHEGYGHWFVDDELVAVAKQRGAWAMAPDAVIEHLHPLFGKAPKDATYELGWSKIEKDKAHFAKRLKKYAPELELVKV